MFGCPLIVEVGGNFRPEPSSYRVVVLERHGPSAQVVPAYVSRGGSTHP